MKKRNVVAALVTLMCIAGCGNENTSTDKYSTEPTFSESTNTGKKTDAPVISSDTSKSDAETSESVDTALEEARKAALAELNAIDLTLYREKEKTELSATIEKAKEKINSEDATIDSIQSIMASVRNYISTLKTDAEYRKEEEEEKAKELKEAKEAKIKEATISDINQYRSEERALALSYENAVKDDINALSTKEDIDAYSLEEYQTKISALRTNADYTMEEMVSYHEYPSNWSLVNEHAYTWTKEKNAVKTQAVGYLWDAAHTYNDFSFCFTVNANYDTKAVGILLGNNAENGTDGINGYLINISVDTAKSFQYVQIFNLTEAYGSSGANSIVYVGGWEYEKTGGKVLGTTFRVVKEGTSLTVYDENDYQKNGSAGLHMSAELNGNNTPTYNDLHMGMINWDGSPADITVDKIITSDSDVVDGITTAKYYADKYLSTIDYTLYRDAEKASIKAKEEELKALYTTGSYSDIMTKMKEMKKFVSEQKTDADYELEENLNLVKTNKINSMFYYEENAYSSTVATQVKAIYEEAKAAVNALTTVDAVNAFDFSPYQTRIDALESNSTKMLDGLVNRPVKSSWDLVQEHASQWVVDRNKITINAVAWQLSDEDYSDFDIVVNANSGDKVIDCSLNQFRGFIVRGNVNESDGSCMDGYVINFSNATSDTQYVQVYYMNASYGLSASPICTYLGGWIYPKTINDNYFRFSFIGNTLKIYDESEYRTSGTNATSIIVDLGGSYTSGKIGVLGWAGTGDFNNMDLTFERIVKR